MARCIVLDGNYALNVKDFESAKKIATEMAQKGNSIVKIIVIDVAVCDVFAIDGNGEAKKVSE